MFGAIKHCIGDHVTHSFPQRTRKYKQVDAPASDATGGVYKFRPHIAKVWLHYIT